MSEVGTTIVRGVSTTRYVVSGEGRTSPVDIWVDTSDQLRRIHLTQTGPTYSQSETTDLFDFGARATINIPVKAARKARTGTLTKTCSSLNGVVISAMLCS